MSREFEVNPGLDDDDDDVISDYADDTGEFLDYEDFTAMGIDPVKPTVARPGSEEKVLMLSARYAAGMPLWHDSDCYDHGPRESELMGSVSNQPRPQPQPQFDLDD